MSDRISQLNRLIYQDIWDIEEGETLFLAYSTYSEEEVEAQLRHLASIGVIRVIEYMDQSFVTALTKEGRDFFDSIPTE
ncbi:MAG TPA: hypothetical protein VLB90_03730 [Pseudomonadales bacterium]|nr:hypothetical protein [Pseudomonadales bacterium]